MKRLYIFILVSLFSANACALHFCEGNVTYTWVENNGSVFIYGTWRNAHTQICNIKSEWKDIDIEVCKAWFSIAQSAQLSQSLVVTRYDDENIADCASISKYGGAPSPDYLMLKR